MATIALQALLSLGLLRGEIHARVTPMMDQERISYVVTVGGWLGPPNHRVDRTTR